MRQFVLALTLLATLSLRADGPSDNVADKVRPVPPPGIEVPADDRSKLEQGVVDLGKSLENLRASKNLRVIDRDTLVAVLEEHHLSLTPLADPASCLEVGRLLGAKYLIWGTYTIVDRQADEVVTMAGASPAAAFDAEKTFTRGGLVVSIDAGGGAQNDLENHHRQTGIDLWWIQGRVSLLPIDGRGIPWDQSGRMLTSFEGWQFKLEIHDNSEEI